MPEFRFRGSRYVVAGLRLAPPAVKLTKVERDLAGFLLSGMPDAEIAEARGVSTRTVINQLATLRRKCGVSSRRELLGYLANLDVRSLA